MPQRVWVVAGDPAVAAGRRDVAPHLHVRQGGEDEPVTVPIYQRHQVGDLVEELSDALLEAYAQIRPLPDDPANHLSALFVLRRMQILLWVIESRDHAAFRDEWEVWARDELDAIATVVGVQRVGTTVLRACP